jgi:tetratricopeptide (TPR) repeat protein
MDRRRVIGHMSSVLGSKEARKAPHFGYAFAVRSTGVAQLLGTALPAAAAATPTTAPGAAEDRTIALTQVFDEIEAAISSAEIQAALARGREAGSITDATRLFAAERMIGMTALPAALVVLQEAAASQRRTELEALVSSLQGDHARALALLQRLPRSPETAGMIGGTLKRRWLQTHADIWLKAARVAYSAEYDRANDPYLGINVAACSLWLHDRAASQRTAAEVSAALSARPDRTAWDEATLAEAYLLLEDFAAARRQYEAAVLRNLGQPRAIAIMRRQARLELAQLGRPSDAFDDLFPVPRIAAFTGHRVDDDEGRGRFPPSRVVAVGQEISRTLAERGIRSGYASAASGGDILFLEALLAAGGEAHVVLPFPIEDFVRTSVGEPWRPRFERILEQVSGRVVVLSDRVPDDRPAAYRRCNEAIMVAAHAEGHLLDELPMLVALVSSASEATPGGTVEMINTWATQHRGAILKIDPS